MPHTRITSLEEFKKMQEENKQKEDPDTIPLSAKEQKQSKFVYRKKIDSLMAWMKKAGADTEKLKLEYQNVNERGVFAASEVKKGDIILHVPDDLILRFEDVDVGLPAGITKEKLEKKWGAE